MRSRRHCCGALLALAVTGWHCGCASVGAPVPPSLELPKPPSDLHAIRKGDRVFLSWSVPARTTDGRSLRSLGPTRICRSLEAVMSHCGSPVGQAQTPSTASPPPKNAAPSKPAMDRYTDTLPPSLEQQNSTTLITYAVEVLNTSERSAGLSNQTRVAAVPALTPPRDFTAQVTAEGIVLKWTEPEEGREAPEIIHRYRIYRREESSATGTLIAELPPDQMLQTQFLDHGFEWEKTSYYHVTPVTLVSLPGEAALAVEGDDTPSLKVWAHDVYPPGVPTALQAVFSGVGQQLYIDLTWAPASEADLAGYNVYRREPGGPLGKLNSQLVKTPAYSDTVVVSGRRNVYSVSAVDVRGNESARSEEASESVP